MVFHKFSLVKIQKVGSQTTSMSISHHLAIAVRCISYMASAAWARPAQCAMRFTTTTFLFQSHNAGSWKSCVTGSYWWSSTEVTRQHHWGRWGLFRWRLETCKLSQLAGSKSTCHGAGQVWQPSGSKGAIPFLWKGFTWLYQCLVTCVPFPWGF